MTAVFVTASGTGVGKTFVARQLVTELRAEGRPVRALKP
jgi:dethiobiotin synthetase